MILRTIRTTLTQLILWVGDGDFCIFVLKFQLVKQTGYIGHANEVEQNATFGMIRVRASVDTDPGAVGDILYLGEELLELRRPSQGDRVCPGRDDEVRVFESPLREAL